jgi:hypothetical protein
MSVDRGSGTRPYLPEQARDDAVAIKTAIEGVISDMAFELQQETSGGVDLASDRENEGSNVAHYISWLRESRGIQFFDYESLRRWSVADIEAFWASIWARGQALNE